MTHKAEVAVVKEKEPETRAMMMTITPMLAREWLEKNIAHNRKVVPAVVARYETDIRAGRWLSNGSTIVMSSTGKIIDGQHRLLAVVAAGRHIDTLVVSGVPDAAFETIDSGRRRLASDILSIMGYTNVTQLAALANMWLYYEKTHRIVAVGGSMGRYQNTTQEVVACVEKHADDFLRATSATATVRRIFKGGSVSAFYWIKLGEIDESDRDYFYARWDDGQHLSAGNAIYALRQVLTRMVALHRHISPELFGGLVVKAWNKYRNHEAVQVLSFPANEEYPEPM